MKTNTIFSVFLTALLIPVLVGSVASAAPRKYTNCVEANLIKSPPNSAGFYMSEDCKTAYVLPPPIGAINLASYVDEIGAGGELCSSINGTIHDVDLRKKNLVKELNQIDARMQKIIKEQAENRNQCLDIDSYATATTNKLKTNQDSQADIKSKITQIDNDLATCSGTQCDDLRTDRLILSDKLQMLVISEENLKTSAQRYSTMQTNCHADQNRVEQALTAENTQYQARLPVLKATIVELNQSTTSLYESQRADPGAMMSITISSEQTALVKKFKELNSSLTKVQFIDMPLSDVNLSFTQIKDGVVSGYPILLKANINGVTVNADNSMTPIPFGNTSNQSVVFGAAVGGSLTINRFAACQLPPSNDYGSSSAATRRHLKDIAGLMTGTATYRYQLGVSRKIKIHYNEKQLYCLIKKQTSSSGLFHSSSSSSITENSQANQWLTISVESEDSGFDFANRDTLLMDLRSEMLDRALMKVAESYLSKERAQLVAPEAPRADGVANELRKCPNLYCQASALALNLGSALFGGTDSDSSTCENVGASSDQDFIDTKPVSAFGTQAFSVKANGAN